jgi:hypothetical protein
VTGVAREGEEEIELLGPQVEGMAVDAGVSGTGIDLEVSDNEQRGFAIWALAELRAYTREQLGQPERLGDVVAGAGVETDDDVDLLAASGQHDDRCPCVVLTDCFADLDPVAVGKAEVEEDEVGGVGVEWCERGGGVVSPFDGVAVVDEGTLELAADARVVFDDQDPWHCGPR